MSVPITVVPEQFTLVHFDAARIATLAAEMAATVGIPEGQEVRVEIDEQSPLGRTEVLGVDPVIVSIESGAFEDAKRPRHLSEQSVRSVLGRLFFKARDRLDPAFGDPPADADLTLRQYVAWDVYAVGRCERAGLRAQKERRRYHFRIRHGFTDVADEAFDRLWAAEDLSWADLMAVCDRTEAADHRADLTSGKTKRPGVG